MKTGRLHVDCKLEAGADSSPRGGKKVGREGGKEERGRGGEKGGKREEREEEKEFLKE